MKKGFKKFPEQCNGCLLPFADELYEPPLNLVFRFKTYRAWYEPGDVRRTSKKKENAYYHSGDMGCLRRCPELEIVTIDRCYIEQPCYAQLTNDHIKLLKKRGHWNPLRRN